MNTVVIIQARMSSTRLPGKVLKKIKGKPLLWYVISRVQQAQSISKVVVATSNNASDDVIELFCKKNNVEYFRGDLENVLSRYYHTAKKFETDIVIRITGDCPLIDGKLIDQGIQQFQKSSTDYLSNTVRRTYPRGFDFEIFTFKALEKAFNSSREAPEREHVTPYIWKGNSDKFRIEHFKQNTDKSQYRITVDTPEDFNVVKTLIEKYDADEKTYAEITEILDTHPEISLKNKHVKQKKHGE